MKYFSRLILALMISFTLTEVPIMRAHAEGLISTHQAVENFNRSLGETNIHKFLDRTDVQEKLQSLGYSAEDAQRRIASLSDNEVKRLNDDIQKATLGGDIGGILVIVLLVILIIYFAKRI